MKNLQENFIKSKIERTYPDLSRNQKIVADFVIDNFDSLPFQSIQDISGATSASVATIVRFAQRLGFSGFSELREQISENLHKQIRQRKLFPLVEHPEQLTDTLTTVANQDILNINATLQRIDRKLFDHAVNLILKAEQIYTMGLGISSLLSQLLAYQLSQVGQNAHPLRHDYAYFSEQVVYMNPAQLIIAFSLPPYSRETIQTAEFARKKKIPLIGITNRSTAPISPFSDVVLNVKSENTLFTNSFAAISVIINALSTECARRDEQRVSSIVKNLDDITNINNELLTDS